MNMPAYSDEELEKQYNLRALRPDYDDKVVPAWRERSAAYRAAASDCRIDVRYGEAPRMVLDWFPAPGAGNKPTLVYFHGGYWQRGDKSDYSFLADAFNRHGVSVVLPNYTLCPDGSITNIVEESRAAVMWLYRHLAELGGDASRIYVTGHSAGGHITGMLMGTDWTALGDDLPLDLIKGGVPISPLMELPPLIPTSINRNVAMDRAEAEAQSPMRHPPVTDAPQLVVCGARETMEFHRQSDIYVDAFVTPTRAVERYSVPDCDHFDELNALADDSSVFFMKLIQLIEAGEARRAGLHAADIDALVAAFNRHDIPGVLSFFAEDVEMYGAAGTDMRGTLTRGHAAIDAALTKRFSTTPDVQWRDADNRVAGNKALSEWRVTGTNPDGTASEVLGCDIYTIENGKITKKDTFYKQIVKA